MHVRFGWCGLILPCLDAAVRGATAMERFGETERSRENRTEGAEEPQRLTRVGEEERLKKVVEREKLEVEEAKPEDEEEEEEGEVV